MLPAEVQETPINVISGFKVNTQDEIILANLKQNIRRHLPQFAPQPTREGEICIVGGGWSLEETLPELLDICWTRGASVIALNGAGKWLLERNIRPAILMMLDARPESAEFMDVEIPGCKYLIASQCDPRAFELCSERETYIYHVVSTDEREATTDILDAYYREHWVEIIGGSTVGLRAISLARMMGFRFMHLFGFDSCYAPDGRHHAYPQALNDADRNMRAYWALSKGDSSTGREFRCSAWQASQAKNFADFLAVNGRHFRLHIHGDGLLAYLLSAGAELQAEDQ